MESKNKDEKQVENVDYQKIIIIGSSGVGKTSILERLITGEFQQTTSTTGVDFKKFTIDVNGKKVDLRIWDTAGQERYRCISRAYFRNAIGVLIVFSLVDRRSFDEVNSWLNDARSSCCQNAQILLIGNKCDLPDQQISSDLAQNFANTNKIEYIETSAKTGHNVLDAFMRTTRKVLEAKSKVDQSNSNMLKIVAKKPKKQRMDKSKSNIFILIYLTFKEIMIKGH